jgi:hypothetical protein
MPDDTIPIPPVPFLYHARREQENKFQTNGKDTMKKTSLMIDRRNRIVKIMILFLAPLIALLYLNYQQVYSAWAVWSETNRLSKLAEGAPQEFQNPTPLEDRFDGKLSPDFWKFMTINGAGEVSNEMAWHAVEITAGEGLTIQHFPDPAFEDENPARREPASERYNNATLIGGSGFRPSPSADVVLKYTARVDKQFYGTAGVIVQPEGTLQENGLFAKPFDMFGFSVTGRESLINGISGPNCYLALNWVPVEVQPLSVDPYTWGAYEIRLRWLSKTEWLGTVSVDNVELCRIPMPAFGPLEVHVWSDNFLVTTQPRRWWELAPAMDLQFQDGGEKRFELGSIQIFKEPR